MTICNRFCPRPPCGQGSSHGHRGHPVPIEPLPGTGKGWEGLHMNEMRIILSHGVKNVGLGDFPHGRCPPGEVRWPDTHGAGQHSTLCQLPHENNKSTWIRSLRIPGHIPIVEMSEYIFLVSTSTLLVRLLDNAISTYSTCLYCAFIHRIGTPCSRFMPRGLATKDAKRGDYSMI